jgi:hypothetical protein
MHWLQPRAMFTLWKSYILQHLKEAEEIGKLIISVLSLVSFPINDFIMKQKLQD